MKNQQSKNIFKCETLLCTGKGALDEEHPLPLFVFRFAVVTRRKMDTKK